MMQEDEARQRVHEIAVAAGALNRVIREAMRAGLSVTITVEESSHPMHNAANDYFTAPYVTTEAVPRP